MSWSWFGCLPCSDYFDWINLHVWPRAALKHSIALSTLARPLHHDQQLQTPLGLPLWCLRGSLAELSKANTC
jgi:hypothetical protein